MVNTSSGWPTSGSYLRGYALGEGKTEASNLSLDWLEPDAANLGAPQGVIPNLVGAIVFESSITNNAPRFNRMDLGIWRILINDHES